MNRFWPQGQEVPTQEDLVQHFAALEAQTGERLLDRAFAEQLDTLDPLKHLKSNFHTPTLSSLIGVVPELLAKEGPEADGVYLCGNSLGLMPKAATALVNEQLAKWQTKGIQAYGDPEGEQWVTVAEDLSEDLGAIVGAQAQEVLAMNTLTVNLHVLLTSFYRPTATRNKILLEMKAFPSDYYAVLSQAKLHGYDESAIIQVDGGTEEVLKVLEERGQEVALLMLMGVQFLTGILQDIPIVTQAAHKQGCLVGWDLAHAVGNVELHLHDWDVDFAAWCSYKYLNGGPGTIGGIFVHSKHTELPRVLGWWGHDLKSRFDMTKVFESQPGAWVYALSTPGLLTCMPLRASLNVFKQTSMSAIRAKATVLTAYLETLILRKIDPTLVKIITPAQPSQRGNQLSLQLSVHTKPVYDYLVQHGVVGDMREPRIIRISPSPLFNTFTHVWRCVDHLQCAMAGLKATAET